MSILAIDYGAKKIGLAKSDEQNKMALPLEIIFNTGPGDVLRRLNQVCEANGIELIVVGVPVSFQNGGKKTFWRQVDLQNQQMKEVIRFINWLKDNVKVPVEIEDERLSTKMAGALRRGFFKKGADDHIAAQLILQTYLDKLEHHGDS